MISLSPVEEWGIMPADDQLAFFEKRLVLNLASVWHNDGRLSQVDIYCLLKSYFGNPNGYFMACRGNHSENFVEWHYMLQKEYIIFEIFGSSRFLELRIYAKDNKGIGTISWDIFVESIQKLIKSEAKRISDEKQELENWSLFINTYKRLRILVDEFYQKLTSISLKEPEPLKLITTKENWEAYQKDLIAYTRNVIEARNIGTTLRMVIPVLAESFVNLIIFILAKEQIKNDPRLYDDLLRKNIDIRVKSLPLYCNGFKEEINQNDENVKSFFRMMNKRNDFLHGNINPAKHTFDNIFFDGTIPLFSSEKDIAVELARESLFDVEPATVAEDYNTAIRFIDYIIDNLHGEFKEIVKMIIEKQQLGWNNVTKRIGILFSDTLMAAGLISK